jgi:predicted phage tail protein
VSNVPPFGMTWSDVAAGSYALTARATDSRNDQTTSAPVSITVNNPPTVTLTAPVQGASFVAGSSITLTANASDTDGTISRVEFYQGSTLIGTATTAPYSVNWSATTPGMYALTAKAFDNLGGMVTSAAATITVSGPQVSLTSPANGASFSAPATITLTAEAT